MLGQTYEAVCACSHTEDEHSGGCCQRCRDPRCAFFVLRFHRETFRLDRWTGPDPVGKYWQLMNPPAGSAAWVFTQLSEADRGEVASVCFQEGLFDRNGELDCRHGNPCPMKFKKTRPDWCVEEYLCEVAAAYLVVPAGACLFDGVDLLAGIYEVEPWVIRFRRLLDTCLEKRIHKSLPLGLVQP